MRYYTIKIPCKSDDYDVHVYFIDLPDKNLPMKHFEALKRISYGSVDIFESVWLRLGGFPVVMLIDEEGKYKNLPINDLATDLYSNPIDVIVGDAWLFLFDGVEDLDYMTETQKDYLVSQFRRFGCRIAESNLEPAISPWWA